MGRTVGLAGGQPLPLALQRLIDRDSPNPTRGALAPLSDYGGGGGGGGGACSALWLASGGAAETAAARGGSPGGGGELRGGAGSHAVSSDAPLPPPMMPLPSIHSKRLCVRGEAAGPAELPAPAPAARQHKQRRAHGVPKVASPPSLGKPEPLSLSVRGLSTAEWGGGGGGAAVAAAAPACESPRGAVAAAAFAEWL